MMGPMEKRTRNPKVTIRVLGLLGLLGLAACSCPAKSGKPAGEGTKSAAVGPNGSGAAHGNGTATAQGSEPGGASTQGGWTRTDAKVRIRLHNLDSIALTDVHVQWPVDSAHFDAIPAKAYTDYVAVGSAYRYAYIKAHAGKRVWICQPMDFVGETTLAPGRYTYEISPAAVMEEKSMGFLRIELLTDKEHP